MSSDVQTNCWKKAKLVDICDRVTDGSHYSPKPQRYGKPIANVKDLRYECVDIESCTRISEKDFSFLLHAERDVQKLAVLLSKDGTIGKVVVYSQNDELVALSSIAILRPSNELDSHYLGYVLQSDNTVQQIALFTAGSALKRVVLRDINQITIPVPPKFEQRIIAKILNNADEAIIKTKALVSKLKAIRRGLTSNLLTRGLNENGEMRDPAKHPEEFRHSSLGIIPKKWTIQRLGKICDLLNGLAFKPSDWTTTGVPIIRIQNLNGGQDFNYYRGVVPEKYYIDPGILLFSWSGNRETSFGPFIWRGPRGVLNQHIFKVMPHDGIRTEWFYYALDDVRQRVEHVAHGGSGLVHIRRPDLCEYLIATPDEREQERIENALDKIEKKIQNEEQCYSKMRAIRMGLMQDLLTGRVRAKVDKSTAQIER
jgi:type I restriction enzyme S subunit